MAIQNAVVSWVLRSPTHGMLSTALAAVRYQGRRTGHTITTPAQYTRRGEDLVILVGRPDTKTWWRNRGVMVRCRPR